MSDQTWTEQEIKVAYWAQFYKSGEHYFSEEEDTALAAMWFPWNRFRYSLGIDVDADSDYDETPP